jgi:gas vesicle protein
MARSKRASIHYVNNKEFSQAVVDYCTILKEAKTNEQTLPIVPDYIASCFLKISEGLSHKSNFIRYTYREEMVMDAVENCLKAIENYDIAAATRTGNPNAFAYFTQISWYAFLRRIAKEKKQQDVKLKYLSQSGLEEYIATDQSDHQSVQVVQAFVNQLKDRIDKVKEKDTEFKEYVKEDKKRKKRTVYVDSDLGDFMEE